MKTEDFFQSKTLKIAIKSLACFIILGFVFGLGVFVGTKKADFSFRWADQYHRNFGGPQGGFFGEFSGMGDDFTNSNGVFGQIIKIDAGSITIKDKDNVEKIVLVNSETSIVIQRNKIKLSDLKVGDNAIVIGAPNANGQIDGELIRVMPPFPKNMQIEMPPLENTIIEPQN